MAINENIQRIREQELHAKSLKELKALWQKEEQLTQTRFEIIIAMLSDDPDLYDMLKDFFEKCEILKKTGFLP